MDVIALTRALVDIPSVTGQEGDVARYLQTCLQQAGFPAWLQELDPGRFNVWAGSRDPAVLLTTHLDTVPPWFPSREEGEWLFGRGACDIKGGIAAMIAAGRRLADEGHTGLGFCFVAGEEEDGLGARKAAAQGIRARYVLNAEPTGNVLVRVQKGYLIFRLRARGKAAHSAFPEQGSSATHLLVRTLERLLRIDFGSDEELGPATLNVGTLAGGLAGNVLASEAEALLMLRSGHPAAQCESRLRLELPPAVEMEVLRGIDPLRLHVVEGFPSMAVPWGSDLPHLQALGKPLMAGPGSVHDAHKADEKILKSQILEAVDLYCTLVERLLRETP